MTMTRHILKRRAFYDTNPSFDPPSLRLFIERSSSCLRSPFTVAHRNPESIATSACLLLFSERQGKEGADERTPKVQSCLEFGGKQGCEL
jgi:hypothetical protein